MKMQTLLLTLLGIALSYLTLHIYVNQDSKSKVILVSNNQLDLSMDTLPNFPKYLVEKDGIITPKGIKYSILIVPADTAQTWTIKKMAIEKNKQFYMLIPEIE